MGINKLTQARNVSGLINLCIFASPTKKILILANRNQNYTPNDAVILMLISAFQRNSQELLPRTFVLNCLATIRFEDLIDYVNNFHGCAFILFYYLFARSAAGVSQITVA